MKVREIELGDLFLASKIFKKIDFKAMIRQIGITDVTGKGKEEKDVITTEKALDMFMYLLSKVDEAEDEILTLIGAWAEMSKEDARKIKLSELDDFVNQFVAVNGQEKITSFFGKAAGLMQKKP